MTMDATREDTSRTDEAGRPLVIGLIGGMGSGKSRVAAEFERHGACVISGDQLGHEALRQPEVRSQVVGLWGADVLDADGQVDRRRLGAVVFADRQQRRALERLVHPWIERRFREVVTALAPACPLVVLDAAILLEAGWNEMCDRIVYVHAPRPLRLQRLAEQRGWSPKEVEAREQAQLSLTAKVSRADAAVDNSGSFALAARQVADLVSRWGRARLER
jgi:dephospho-CoA kinase